MARRAHMPLLLYVMIEKGKINPSVKQTHAIIAAINGHHIVGWGNENGILTFEIVKRTNKIEGDDR